jgi:hypothetical protein
MSLLAHRTSLMGLALSVFVSLSTAQQPPSDDELGAKALFYNTSGAVVSVPSATPAIDAKSKPSSDVATAPVARAKPSPSTTMLALRASVLLVGPDGGTREVKPSHKFQSGDRLKLAFTSNVSGYFYLATVGSTGKVQVLAPRRGEPAVLEAGFRYQFPAAQTGFFKFDQQPGKEELWAVLTDEPLSAIDLGAGRIAQVQQPENSRLVSQAVASAADDMASKDLVFEEDTQAVYASLKPSTMPRPDSSKRPRVMVKLVLDHQ